MMSLARMPYADSAPGIAGTITRGMSKGLCQLAGVQSARAAECNQGKLPRIVAALDRHDPERALHVRVHHANHALGERLQ